jgi:serine/threonine protein kinase
MNAVHDHYTKEMNNLFKQNNLAAAPNYKLKEWFLTLFSESKITAPPSEYPPEFVRALNDLIENIIWDSRDAIETYKKEVSDHIKQNLFRRSRMRMAGLSANLLELLSMLKDNGVAIRDLKPDNMFIKGDSSRISLFLANPHEYAIGVIDFETAIGINPPGKKFPQPLLGGTPAYATLSNFIVNELLRYLLGDISRVLHLQDWYATIGMIYNVVTGDSLFVETKKLLPQIMAIMQRTPMDKEQLVNFFKTNSRLFWSSAAKELRQKLEADKERLCAVQVPMIKSTKNVTRAIKQDILYENNKLNKKIYEHVISQNYFSSVKHKKRLFESSVSKIQDFIKVWENPKNFPKVPQATKAEMLTFLKELHKLKSQSEKNGTLLDKLDGPNPRISVYDLLPLMFNTVRKGMYKEAWGALVEYTPAAASGNTGSSGTDYDATVVV